MELDANFVEMVKYDSDYDHVLDLSNHKRSISDFASPTPFTPSDEICSAINTNYYFDNYNNNNYNNSKYIYIFDLFECRYKVPLMPPPFDHLECNNVENICINDSTVNNNKKNLNTINKIRADSSFDIYFNFISIPNMMTMDITKTEPGLVGLSSNQQQQQSAQQQQQQQAANMNNNGQNNNGNNNGLSNGNSVNSNNNNNNTNNNSNNNNNNSNVQSIAAAANNNNNNNNGSQLCAGCGKHIQDRYLLRALDMLWHEDCLKCGCCDCRLGEVGSTLYTKGNLMLCKRDYLRLFGNTGYCAACSKVIPAFEMVMRARTNVYHLECFACQQCNHRFCVGDRFYLCENKILCEYDYEERLVFASMANHPMLKRHVSTLGQGSPTGAAGAAGAAGGLLGGGPVGVSGGANVNGGPGILNGPRTPGDHNNNNNGPQTPTGGNGGGGSPFAAAAAAAAAAAHMKNQLGASS